MGKKGLSFPIHFSQTLITASHSPLVCWSLHRQTFSSRASVRRPSLARPPSRCHPPLVSSRRPSPIGPSFRDLLRPGLHQDAFSCRSPLGDLLRLGLHPKTFFSWSFIGSLLPLASFWRPSPAGLVHKPSLAGFPHEVFSYWPSPRSLHLLTVFRSLS